MNIANQWSKPARSLWIGLILVLVLSACAGKTETSAQNNQPNLLAARQGELSAQELPKSADPVAAEISDAQAAASAYQPAPAALAAKIAPAGAALAAAAGAPAAAAAAAAPAAFEVDQSLPIEARTGARAPDFSLQTLDGQTVRLADLLGKPVVISYWATWCVPCKQELPVLQKLYEEYAAQGLVVLTVNALDQDALDAVQAMVGEVGMTYPVLLDGEKAFAGAYQAMFFPSTYFIDPNGVIREIRLGDTSENDLRLKVERLLAGQL